MTEDVAANNIRAAQFFSDELRAAGFSTRATNALVYSSGIGSLEELRSRPWGDRQDTTSLQWALSVRGSLGPREIAEVVAFREGRDPRKAVAPIPMNVVVPLQPDDLAALDAWIAEQAKPLSRSQAVGVLMTQGLVPQVAGGTTLFDALTAYFEERRERLAQWDSADLSPAQAARAALDNETGTLPMVADLLRGYVEDDPVQTATAGRLIAILRILGE